MTNSYSYSNLLLAQAWPSTIYQDDASIRQSAYSREMMNEEQFHFNLGYLQMRKCLILGDRSDTMELVRRLDGLFNSNYKESVIASLLLEELPEEEDCFKDLNETGQESYCDVYSPSLDSQVLGSFDSILLDPYVGVCRKTSLFCETSSPSKSVSLYSSLTVESSLPFNDSILGDDSLGSGLLYSNSDLISTKGEDSLVLKLLHECSPEPVRKKATYLVLYNSFEILDMCLDEENQGVNIVGQSTGISLGSSSNHKTTEESSVLDNKRTADIEPLVSDSTRTDEDRLKHVKNSNDALSPYDVRVQAQLEVGLSGQSLISLVWGEECSGALPMVESNAVMGDYLLDTDIHSGLTCSASDALVEGSSVVLATELFEAKELNRSCTTNSASDLALCNCYGKLDCCFTTDFALVPLAVKAEANVTLVASVVEILTDEKVLQDNANIVTDDTSCTGLSVGSKGLLEMYEAAGVFESEIALGSKLVTGGDVLVGGQHVTPSPSGDFCMEDVYKKD